MLMGYEGKKQKCLLNMISILHFQSVKKFNNLQSVNNLQDH